MELYAGIDVIIRESNLPLFIKGFLREDNGVYYIYINSNISQEEKKRTLKHEYLHLVYRDIDNQDQTETIERRCNEL